MDYWNDLSLERCEEVAAELNSEIIGAVQASTEAIPPKSSKHAVR